MAAGEDDAVAVGGEEAAGGSSPSSTNELRLAISFSAFRVPSSAFAELHRVKLVEHVLARHGLEDDRAAVRGAIAFPSFGEIEGDLADVFEVLGFDRVFGVGARGRIVRSEER